MQPRSGCALMLCACACDVQDESAKAAGEDAVIDSESGRGEAGSGATSSSGDDNGTHVPPVAALSEVPDDVNYHQDIEPILAVRCLGCHVEGQIGPFALDGYDNASTHAAIASRAVETGLMPPFRADDSDCWTIEDRRKMTPQERAYLIKWAQSDAPEGDPVASVRVAVQQPQNLLGAPTSEYWSAESYEPAATGRLDDYRCYVIDPGITSYVPLQGLGVVTDNYAGLHHSVLYVAIQGPIPTTCPGACTC